MRASTPPSIAALREGIGETEGDRREARREAELLETRILASYPFHPDLLDLMYHRWGSLPSYQRTRGALQFLATVVHALWRNGGGAQPLIGPGDVPLADDEVRGALFSQVGEREHFTSVLDADLTSTRAGVRDVDRRMAQESPALQYLRVGSRLATAAFLYSFGARTGEDQGVLENELITAALAPGLDRMVLLAALSDLRKNLLYLHHTSGRYLFKTAPNLNKLIGDEAAKFSAKDVLARVRTALEAQLRLRWARVLCWPEDSAAIPEREPVFRVAYLDLEWARKPTRSRLNATSDTGSRTEGTRSASTSMLRWHSRRHHVRKPTPRGRTRASCSPSSHCSGRQASTSSATNRRMSWRNDGVTRPANSTQHSVSSTIGCTCPCRSARERWRTGSR
ncbi:MAG: DUF499 domain-containing protein [Anaerolineae bacterium]|nr:DUF499 domain-containing protein [Anaerolineae bacterium]